MVQRAKVQRLLACIGEPSRFRLLTTLLRGDRCVSEIAHIVGLSQSCTTRHLQALQREGVVTRSRAGKRVIFRLADHGPEISRVLELAFLRAPLGPVPDGQRAPSRAPRERKQAFKDGRANAAETPVDEGRPGTPALELAEVPDGPGVEEVTAEPERAEATSDLEDYLL